MSIVRTALANSVSLAIAALFFFCFQQGQQFAATQQDICPPLARKRMRPRRRGQTAVLHPFEGGIEGGRVDRATGKQFSSRHQWLSAISEIPFAVHQPLFDIGQQIKDFGGLGRLVHRFEHHVVNHDCLLERVGIRFYSRRASGWRQNTA